MTYVAYAVAAWLFLAGLYGIVTSRHLVHLCGCLTVTQASTYVLLAAIGYRPGAAAPVFVDQATQAAAIAEGQKVAGSPEAAAPAFVDPVVQALMLTDIVVEAAVVALLLALTVQIQKRTGSVDPDQIDYLRG